MKSHSASQPTEKHKLRIEGQKIKNAPGGKKVRNAIEKKGPNLHGESQSVSPVMEMPVGQVEVDNAGRVRILPEETIMKDLNPDHGFRGVER